MLNRNDLAKQFELVVQQEIKNFQDVSYQLNQTLNELMIRLENLENSYTKTHSLSESRHKSLSIQVDVLKEDQELIDHRMKMYAGGTDYYLKKLETDIHDFLREESITNNRITDAQNEIDSLKKFFCSTEERLKVHAGVIENSLNQINLNVGKMNSKFMAEILDLIPEKLGIVRQDLEEKVSAHKLDVEGLLREIRIIGKRVMVIEKNIENIYSLIEDKKKREVTL